MACVVEQAQEWLGVLLAREAVVVVAGAGRAVAAALLADEVLAPERDGVARFALAFADSLHEEACLASCTDIAAGAIICAVHAALARCLAVLALVRAPVPVGSEWALCLAGCPVEEGQWAIRLAGGAAVSVLSVTIEAIGMARRAGVHRCIVVCVNWALFQALVLVEDEDLVARESVAAQAASRVGSGAGLARTEAGEGTLQPRADAVDEVALRSEDRDDPRLGCERLRHCNKEVRDHEEDLAALNQILGEHAADFDEIVIDEFAVELHLEI